MIDAAVKNKIAIEINNRYQLPRAAFIRVGNAAGVKLSFGTNNGDRNRLDGICAADGEGQLCKDRPPLRNNPTRTCADTT